MFTDTEHCPVINASPSGLSQCASEHQLYALRAKIILDFFDRAERCGAPLLKDQQLPFFSCERSIFVGLRESDSVAREGERGDEPRPAAPPSGQPRAA